MPGFAEECRFLPLDREVVRLSEDCFRLLKRAGVPIEMNLPLRCWLKCFAVQ